MGNSSVEIVEALIGLTDFNIISTSLELFHVKMLYN